MGLSGFMRRLRKRQWAIVEPQRAVVVSEGAPEARDRGAALDGVLNQRTHFIQKPFASRALAHAVRKALGISEE